MRKKPVDALTLTQFINQLKVLFVEHGDLPVCMHNPNYRDDDELYWQKADIEIATDGSFVYIE